MCGIAGSWSRGGTRESTYTTVRAMATAMSHRGPDDEGTWIDPRGELALSHRRLSIVDLSPLGRQPMVSGSGRYVLVFNGEIYNHVALRRELLASGRCRTVFRGSSDTEVMLAAIEAYGLREAVERFVGMFAFALWDAQERCLRLVRDRLGIKPLYYGWTDRCFIFGSELKAFAAHPEFQAEVDRGAVALLLRHNCIPAPHSIYRGVHKLRPATILSLQSPETRQPSCAEFWSATQVAATGLANPFEGTSEDAACALDALLREAVGIRMVAEVPLGAFLSGGIDSSTVVALMQAQSARPIRTFSIGSPDNAFDEASHARAVARHLGTDHTELYVGAQEAQSVIPQLPVIYDEPFADSSQIPTFLVSRLARQQVTIALSGDGGDEVFGGYNRHVWAPKIAASLHHLPLRARAALARGVIALSPGVWTGLLGQTETLLPRALLHQGVGDKLHKLADVLACGSPDQMYASLASHWDNANRVVRRARSASITCLADAPGADFTSRMLLHDLVTYLPDDILTKVDRASMAVSLEARVPLLDHRVVEFAWRLPTAFKVRGTRGKWLLRQVLSRYVPQSLVDRPKSGFGVPLGDWLRGPLRPWADDLLGARRMDEDGYLDPAPVREKWSEHLSGRRNWCYHLWDVLMFQAWLASQPTRHSVAERSDSAPAAVSI